ncbi:MAG TPA: gamma-glutamylcyclotransferase family protein [Gammaproteobacteria bacterium]
MKQHLKRRIDHLFVYGTLRAAFDHPLQRSLRRHARRLGTAQVAGRLYDLGRYPGLVPDTAAGPVAGDLYRLRQARALLAMLDRYEGCAARMPRPREYRRIPVAVHWRGGSHWAWVYVYNRSVKGLRAIPGGDYCAPPGGVPHGRPARS